jgi:hypothetical protein
MSTQATTNKYKPTREATTNKYKPRGNPTSVRLTRALDQKLESLGNQTSVSRSALIALAVTSFLDYIERTGTLPLPTLTTKEYAN